MPWGSACQLPPHLFDLAPSAHSAAIRSASAQTTSAALVSLLGVCCGTLWAGWLAVWLAGWLGGRGAHAACQGARPTHAGAAPHI